MSERHQPNHEIKSVEAALRNLTSSPAQLNRDELMYQAGWSAALDESKSNATVRAKQPAHRSQRQWFFPALSMVATTAALVFFGLFMMTQQSQNPTGSVADESIPEAINETNNQQLIAKKAGIEALIREKVRQERLRNVTKTVYGSALKAGSTLVNPANKPVNKRSLAGNSAKPKTHVGLMNELIERRPVSFGN